MQPRRDFAHSVVIDYETHDVIIDGRRVPYWLTVGGPEVETPTKDNPLSVLTLPIYVDGTIIIKGDGRDTIIDPILGDVGQWATNYVRAAMAARLPWLEEITP